ncbi:MAG: germination protein YpeB [Heliobacteriaceae bacterium]|nr:germination protein YpeB [Heliobacteriaceae bacterium]MDD4586811.1 germination protein YpeB [Heliobacteriaceae bacterium]
MNNENTERTTSKLQENVADDVRRSRSVFRFFTGVLALSTALLGFLYFQQYEQNRAYQMKTENQYQRAFLDMSGHIENMELEMSKVLVSNSANTGISGLSDVTREASHAAGDLGQLPLVNLLLSRTNQFINQAGDYCYNLSQKKVNDPGSLTPTELKQLSELQRQTLFLRDELRKMGEQLNSRTITWIDLERNARKQEQTGSQSQTAWLPGLWNKVITALAGQGPESQAPPILANFQFVETELQKFSSLEYDGKFSETIKVSPRGLGTGQITQEQALQIAQSFLGKDNLEGHTLKVAGEGKAAIPAFAVSVVPNDAPEKTVINLDISKTGGHVVWMLKDRPVDGIKVSRDECAAAAKAYLDRRGMRNFEVVTAEEYQNMAVIILVPKQGDLSLYPDKIKVRVAMDDREVVGYDATAYLTFHHNRQLAKPKITREEAQKKLSPYVQVTGTKQVLLAKDNYQEVECWEFSCIRAGQDYLIYINNQNGREEKIFSVINTPAGRFIF